MPSTVPQPGEQVGLHEADARLVQVGVLLGQGDGLLVEVDAHHLLGLAQRLGVDGEAARVAAQVQHAPARAELRQRLAVVALIEEEAGLVLAARRHPEPQAVLGDDPGAGGSGGRQSNDSCFWTCSSANQ